MKKRSRKSSYDSRQAAFLRYMLIVAVIVVWIGGISARLVYLQVNQHSWLKGKATSQRVDIKKTKMLRGSIYDRNERALAVSVTTNTLFADATQIEDTEKAATDLAKATKSDRSKLLTILKEAKDLERRYVPIAKGLDDIAADQVNAALDQNAAKKHDLPRYPGLHWREEQKRTYPHQSLAAHVVGFSNAEGIGQAGIEQSQNDILYGAVIRKEQERDRLGRVYDETVSEKEPPNDVYLTISSSLQFKTETALAKAVRAASARAGMAIVLDHKTGEILALANYPTFNPNEIDGINNENLSNRCVQGVYAPGSVFKLLTYGSAFEKRLLTPDSEIDSGNGTIDVAGHVFTDSHAIGRVTATKAFAQSSNVCAIRTGMRVGREDFFGNLQKFGFGRATGVELPAETSGIVRQPARWNGDSLASMSIGYEIGVSALQMATSFATIANNGIRVKPHIIKEIRQSDQTKVFETQPESERVVSTETAQYLRTVMRAVVTDGTGKRAQLDGYTSAGKTGTAWKFDEKTKRVSSAKYVSSFIGMAPAENPAVTIAVVFDEPKVGGRNGGQVAAPAFKEIAEGILSELRIPRDLTTEPQATIAEEIKETVGDREKRGPSMDERPLNDMPVEAEPREPVAVPKNQKGNSATAPTDKKQQGKGNDGERQRPEKLQMKHEVRDRFKT